MSKIDRSFRVQFVGSNNFYNNFKFVKTSDSFSSKTKLTSSQTDKDFKIYFNSSNNNFSSKTNFNENSNTFKPKAEVTPTEEDIYYDEIIYYDGGGVDGWLSKDDM